MPPKDKKPEYDNDTGLSMSEDLDKWVPSDGFQYAGGNVTTATVDGVDPGVGTPMDVSYSFGDIDFQQGDLFENQLRDKYPALKQAYEHYQNVLDMCKTREKEEDA